MGMKIVSVFPRSNLLLRLFNVFQSAGIVRSTVNNNCLPELFTTLRVLDIISPSWSLKGSVSKFAWILAVSEGYGFLITLFTDKALLLGRISLAESALNLVESVLVESIDCASSSNEPNKNKNRTILLVLFLDIYLFKIFKTQFRFKGLPKGSISQLPHKCQLSCQSLGLHGNLLRNDILHNLLHPDRFPAC